MNGNIHISLNMFVQASIRQAIDAWNENWYRKNQIQGKGIYA